MDSCTAAEENVIPLITLSYQHINYIYVLVINIIYTQIIENACMHEFIAPVTAYQK